MRKDGSLPDLSLVSKSYVSKGINTITSVSQENPFTATIPSSVLPLDSAASNHPLMAEATTANDKITLFYSTSLRHTHTTCRERSRSIEASPNPAIPCTERERCSYHALPISFTDFAGRRFTISLRLHSCRLLRIACHQFNHGNNTHFLGMITWKYVD